MAYSKPLPPKPYRKNRQLYSTYGVETALLPESQQRERQPKANKHMRIENQEPFEDDVARLLENAKFRGIRDDFIQVLEKDKKKIDASKNVFVFANKIKQEIFTKWKLLHTTSLSPKTSRRHTNTQKTTP